MADPNDFRDWLFYANDDLESANILMQHYPPKMRIAAYHCQQCAEKALKGYLIANKIEPPYIHDIKRLCDLCIKIDADFTKIAHCDYLTDFATISRYPDEIEITQAQTQKALANAEAVLDFVKGKLK